LSNQHSVKNKERFSLVVFIMKYTLFNIKSYFIFLIYFIVYGFSSINGLYYSINASAQGFSLSEYRVIFDGRKRGKEINITNSEIITRQYSVSFVEVTYRANGSSERVDIAEADWPIASTMLRLAPRRPIILQPGETQSIRIALRKPRGLKAGEYRSHLRIEASAIPDPTPENARAGALRIATRIGFSIPVIVRHEVSGSTVSLLGMTFDQMDVGDQLTVDLRKNTPAVSAYGEIEVKSRLDGNLLAGPVGVAIPMEVSDTTIALTMKHPPDTWPPEAELVYIDADRKTETVLTRFSLTR